MKKVLISPMYGMGDNLLITPALKVLKEAKPDFYITCITFQKVNYELFQNNPYIDELIFYPFLSESKIKGLAYIFKNISFKYDVCINFYPSNRLDYNVFSFLTFAKERVGHRYIKADFSQFNWLKNKTIKENSGLHCVEENIKLLNFFGIQCKEMPPMQVYLTNQEENESQSFINYNSRKKVRIGIHTGTSSFKNHKNRRWDKENFLKIVDIYY